MTTDGTMLTYTVCHEAWYRATLPGGPEIMIHRAHPDGGILWEFGIREHPVGGIRVEVFDDAFAAFAEIPEFFARLVWVDTLAEVREALDDLGFTDTTKREPPAGHPGADGIRAEVAEIDRLRDLVAKATAGDVSQEERARIRAAAGLAE